MDIISNIFYDYYWYICIVHIILAVILFFIVNWIGAQSISVGYMQMNITIREDSAPAFNFLFKVVSPIVFIVLCAVAFETMGLEQLNQNIDLVVVFYWIIRLLWILCAGRSLLTNWFEQCVYWSISIGLSVFVYGLLDSVDQILPSPRALLDQLWILIIVFIYSTINRVNIARSQTTKRKNNYIRSKYLEFQNKYGNIIKEGTNNDFYESLTYSIMIYEDFNRPKLVRYIEYVSFWIKRKPHTLGIMQVMTNEFINDEDSIRLAMGKIIDDGKRAFKEYSEQTYFDSHCLAYNIAHRYNPGDANYANEIGDIYSYISSMFYKDIPDSYNEFLIFFSNDRVENI